MSSDYDIDSLIESVFISSFIYTDIKIIDNTNTINSMCKHKLCSFLPSIYPQILYKFPKTDSKNSSIEINDLLAWLCYPYGIKVCYEQDEKKNIFEKFTNIITNQYGTRHYLFCYHFYKKIKTSVFRSSVKYNEPIPIAIENLSNELINISNIKKHKDILEKLKLIKLYLNTDYVYVPHCLCFVSKFPYITQFDNLSSYLYNIITNNNVNIADLTNFLTLLLKGFPIPNEHQLICFDLPNYNNIDINISSCHYDEYSLSNEGIRECVHTISPDNILILIRLILTEKKLVFLSNSYDALFKIIYGLLGLIYPFKWPHGLIPILNISMSKYLSTIVPYIFGIHEDIYSAFKNTIYESQEDIYIFHIQQGTFSYNKSSNVIKKM